MTLRVPPRKILSQLPHLLLAVWIFSLAACAHEPASPPQNDLVGAWQAGDYLLKTGRAHKVNGHIFFAEKDWTVLFFVMDENGQPARGSAEGGVYSTAGDSLTFRHLHHLSQGNAIGTLPESPLRMETKSLSEAASEPCRFEIHDDQLTLFFPSGNRMTFTKSAAN